MAARKANFEGNPFLGLFARATDEFVIIPSSAMKKFEEAAVELAQNVVRASVSSSAYVGLYSAANRNGIVLPPFCSGREIEMFEKAGVAVEVLEDTKFCALGNNVACNDKGAIVNEEMPRKDVGKIEDALGVEAVPMKIFEYKTVGMMVVATNKGFVAHNRITEEELQQVESALGVKGLNATVNCGTAMVGLGIVANSKSAIIGETSTGFEAGRVEQALELTD